MSNKTGFDKWVESTGLGIVQEKKEVILSEDEKQKEEDNKAGVLAIDPHPDTFKEEKLEEARKNPDDWKKNFITLGYLCFKVWCPSSFIFSNNLRDNLILVSISFLSASFKCSKHE